MEITTTTQEATPKRELKFSDYVGLGTEITGQIDKLVDQLPEELRATGDALKKNAEVFMILLKDRRQQDEWMADDLQNIAATLKGEMRAEMIGGPDDIDFELADQGAIGEWVADHYPFFSGPHNRSIGCLEECLELCLASGVSAADMAKVFRFVVERQAERKDAGDPREELADLIIMAKAYAEDSQIEAEIEVAEKMMFIMERSPEECLERVKRKIERGMPYRMVQQETPKEEQ